LTETTGGKRYVAERSNLLEPDELAASLRVIFDAAADVILISDDHGVLVSVNEAAATLFGVPRHDLVGRSFGEFVPMVDDVPAPWSAVLATGTATGEVVVRRADGSLRSTEYRSTANIRPGRHLTVLRDVTVQKSAEKALLASERRYRLLVESSADVVTITDPGTFRYVSPSVEAMLGYRANDLVGKPTADFVHPDDVPVVREGLAGILASSSSTARIKFRVRHADGTYRIVEATGRNFLDEPTVGGVVVNLHDVTERELAQRELTRQEASLRESQATLQAAQAMAHVGIWTSRLRGGESIHSTWSTETLRIFGLDPVAGAHPSRQHVRDLVDPEDLAHCDAALLRTLQTGVAYDVQFRITRPDGAVRWVHAQAVVARGADGLPERLVGTMLDITERMQVKDELIRREEKLRAVLDGALHAILLANDDGIYVDANVAAQRVFGLSRDEIVGKHKDQLLSAGGHLGVLHDLTERKRSEAALLESERRFRLLVETSNDVVCISVAGQLSYVSPAITNVLGYETDELVGTVALDLIHTDDRAEVAACRQAMWDGTGPKRVQLQLRMRHKDGSYRLVDMTVRDFSAEAVVAGIIINFHDITERELALDELRRSEATLKESQATLERAQTLGHIGSWTVEGLDLDAKLTASPETFRIYGIDPSTFTGDRSVFQRAFQPDDWCHAHGEIAAAAVAGGPFAYDARITRASGDAAFVHIEGVVEAPRDGKPGRVVGTTLDITERKRVEAELRASEARYRRIIETTAEGVWVCDAERKTTFVNGRMAALLGYQADEMLGMSIMDIADIPVAETDAQFAQVQNAGGGVFETRLRRKDGTHVWAKLATAKLVDVAGKFEGSLAMVTDITEQRQIDELRSQFAAIVESSNDAILSKSLDGTILSWNEGAERLYGYSSAEAIGRPVTMLAAPHLPDTEPETLARVASGERVEHRETTRQRKDGSLVEVSLTVSPMRANGKVVGASAIARDITERRRAELAELALRNTEEQLRQAQKLEALGQLAGGVAHDFNNILSVILGYTSILKEELPVLDPIREDISEIHEAGMRASDLTRQLLAFSRKQVLKPRVISLGAVVAKTEKMLGRLVGEDIQLVVLDTPLSTAVKADPGQLEQVLVNLVVNARDAMPTGGRLLVGTERVTLTADEARSRAIAPGDYATLRVTDTGIGMDEALLARVFEPFFTTKEKGKGTGLGLATVFGIVKQSAGHVEVASLPGSGTSFRIFLPATDASPDDSETTEDADRVSAARPTETILLVEDEDQVRTLACNVLRRAGYKVLDAANAGEAVLTWEQHANEIDILVTDVVMPRMGGHSLALRLREQRPELKVLYISGYTDDTVLHHGVELGELAFLAKPFTSASLTAKVRDVLDATPPSLRPGELRPRT
jgi:two-component system cell cycle sensor histidine kinase/response regulator CckA